MKKKDLQELAGFNNCHITKPAREDNITTDIVEKIHDVFDINGDRIMDFVEE